MARNRPQSLLTQIPPAAVIRENLIKARETVRGLEVLLQTAQQIEATKSDRKQEPAHVVS